MARVSSTRRSGQSQPTRAHGEVQGGRRTWEAVYSLVRAIPHGRVMTYGQIAGLLGNLLSPKAVGWAMHTCPDDVPWHRVVNASGACSTDRRGDLPPGLQQALLEAEGVEFRLDGTLDLGRWRWEPPTRPVSLRGRRGRRRPRQG
ncbi:MAG TPA: MGMT family protein [Thermoanaerobaculaceae bacterium]|nr:MGMT family protein [Thermoanaerobaculaceae bacterium]